METKEEMKAQTSTSEAKPAELTVQMVDIIARLRESKKYPAARIYRSTLHSFTQFIALAEAEKTDGEKRPEMPEAFARKTLTTEAWAAGAAPFRIGVADAFTPGRLKAYQEWLRQRKAKWNTVSTYMRTLRAVYNRIYAPGSAAHNPRLFDNVYTKVESKTKRALTEDETAMLIDAALGLLHETPPHVLPKRTALVGKVEKSMSESSTTIREVGMPMAESSAAVRATEAATAEACRTEANALTGEAQRAIGYFALMFLFHGMPFIDLAYLRKQDVQGNTITYCRHKTGAQLTVRIPREAKPLFDAFCDKRSASSWLFPILSDAETDDAKLYEDYLHSLRQFNRQLAVVAAALLPGTKLSSYTPRHTWATLAFHSELPVGLISKALGHSSVKVTETYLKPFEDAKVDAANEQLILSIREKRKEYGQTKQVYAG